MAYHLPDLKQRINLNSQYKFNNTEHLLKTFKLDERDTGILPWKKLQSHTVQQLPSISQSNISDQRYTNIYQRPHTSHGTRSTRSTRSTRTDLDIYFKMK